MGSTASFKNVSRPIPFPATKNIQVTIKEYNPIRYDMLVEDSSSSLSIGDTAKLASMINFPTLPKTGATSALIPASLPTASSLEGVALDSAGFISEIVIDADSRTARSDSDCVKIKSFMVNLDEMIRAIERNTNRYKQFLSGIEVISHDYTFLKAATALTPSVIINRLENSFIRRFNSLLPAEDDLNANPALVSSRELSDLESNYFKQIADLEVRIDEISTAVLALDGRGTGFVDLLKTFLAVRNKTTESVRELRNLRIDKLLPTFNKKLLMFDELQKYMADEPVYITRSIRIDKDFHRISVFARDRETNVKTLYDNIDIEPTGGFKVTVSAGVFVSGLTDVSFAKKTMDSMYAKQYLLNGLRRDTTVSQTFTSIYEKEQKEISYGGMLYLTAHSQNACFVNYGGYIGFGALFNDQTRWAGAAGLSLILGKSQKFAIHAGAVMSQVDRLTQPYAAGKWYPELIDNIPTYRAWDLQAMVGFSWSLR